MGFKLTGEGFILIAQLSYGISTVLINLFSRKVSPVVLSGTQFAMGGIVLTLIGVGMGGHLGNVTVGGVAIIFYLAMVSAVAYTLWSVLLAWNDVSKVAIFGFVNPLCSVILSALILGEVKQAFNIGSLIALLLVCAGIYIVNCKENKEENLIMSQKNHEITDGRLVQTDKKYSHLKLRQKEKLQNGCFRKQEIFILKNIHFQMTNNCQK